MKRNLLLPLCVCLLFIGSCKKENKDLTSGIVGTFWNGETSSSRIDITVIKVDESTVSIDIDGYSAGSGLYMSTKMNSENSFTLNTRNYSENRYLIGDCNIEAKGTGVYSNGNITIEVQEKQTLVNSPYTVTNTTHTYTAAKQ
jgi:hypothetical protein